MTDLPNRPNDDVVHTQPQGIPNRPSTLDLIDVYGVVENITLAPDALEVGDCHLMRVRDYQESLGGEAVEVPEPYGYGIVYVAHDGNPSHPCAQHQVIIPPKVVDVEQVHLETVEESCLTHSPPQRSEGSAVRHGRHIALHDFHVLRGKRFG
jgi:hypothetical protein